CVRDGGPMVGVTDLDHW
nr:immunoglobulin heavy chain junction region [Macaca mulatta]MOV40633.1 immunoglobulin heavy chain junction region [Macaca mulatta]MOV44032.1 immunoglobulin heavy chain junction region [Macaca mulatta]